MRKYRTHIENKRFWDLSADQLRFIIKDAKEAIAAMPDNPKCSKYADEINDACTVLAWRNR